jgi:hypothetical protein
MKALEFYTQIGDVVPTLVQFEKKPNGTIKKNMIRFRELGLTWLSTPSYRDWELNEKIYKNYTNPMFRCSYDKTMEEARHKFIWTVEKPFPRVLFAGRTDITYMLDPDHPLALQIPEIQRLVKIAPYTDSLGKGNPHIPICIQNMPESLLQVARIVLIRRGKDLVLELLKGQFHFFDPDQTVHNANCPIYTYSSWSEFLNAFSIDEEYASSLTPSFECPLMDEFVYQRVLSKVQRLVDIDKDREYNTYDKWVLMLFLFANVCGGNKEMGKDIAITFSKQIDDNGKFDESSVINKFEDMYSVIGTYDSTPATEATLDNILLELELKHGIPRQRLLTNDSSSTDSESFTGSLALTCDNDDTVSENDEETQTLEEEWEEIEKLLSLFQPTFLQKPYMKEMLMHVIYNLDDTELGYNRCKDYFQKYAQCVLTDTDAGNLYKKWCKINSNQKKDTSALRKALQRVNKAGFQTLIKSKENYHMVKEKFEKRVAKCNNPVCFIDVNPDGVLQVLSQKQLLVKYENLKCKKFCKIEGKVIPQLFIGNWFFDTNIKTIDKMDFNPDTLEPLYYENGLLVFNLFRGLECMDFEKYPSVAEDQMKEPLDKFLWLIRHQLCNDNKDFYDMFMKLLAQAIQTPGKKWRVMVVLKSIQGIGKGMFCDFFGNCMIGNLYYKMVDNADQILGHFNESRMHKLFINLNELRRKDASENQGSLKGAITEQNVEINGKGKPVITVRNETNYFVTTNVEIPVPVEMSDRRIVAIESEAPKLSPEDATYLSIFLNIRQKNKPFIAKFRDHLLSIDISDFIPERDRVQTDFYREMQHVMTPPHIAFLYDYFFVRSWKDDYQEHVLMKGLQTSYTKWKQEYLSRPIGKKELYDSMIKWRREARQEFSAYSENKFGRHITHVLEKLEKLTHTKLTESIRINNIHHAVFPLDALKNYLETIFHLAVEKDIYEVRIMDTPPPAPRSKQHPVVITTDDAQPPGHALNNC